MTDLHEIGTVTIDHSCITEHLLLLHLTFKIQDGGRPMRLRDSFCMSKSYRDFSIFKTAAVAMMDRLKLIF